MANSGDEVVLLKEGLAIPESILNQGDPSVLYTEDLARGESNVNAGDDVVLITEQVAQGPAGSSIVLDPLILSNYILYKGDTLDLSILASNPSSNDIDYTLEFTEDGSVFDSETATVPKNGPPPGTYEYTASRTKSSSGSFTYQANTSAEKTATWMVIRGITGPSGNVLQADPLFPLPGNSTDLTVGLENPGSTDRDVTVRFFADGSQIDSITKTISSGGGTATYTTTESRSSEVQVNFTAEVEVASTGTVAPTNSVLVDWASGSVTADTDGDGTVDVDLGINGSGETHAEFYFDEGFRFGSNRLECTIHYSIPEGTYAVIVSTGEPDTNDNGTAVIDIAAGGTLDLEYPTFRDDVPDSDDTFTNDSYTANSADWYWADNATDGGGWEIGSGPISGDLTINIVGKSSRADSDAFIPPGPYFVGPGGDAEVNTVTLDLPKR